MNYHETIMRWAREDAVRSRVRLESLQMDEEKKEVGVDGCQTIELRCPCGCLYMVYSRGSLTVMEG